MAEEHNLTDEMIAGRRGDATLLPSDMPRWMAGLFGVLHRNASDPTAFFCIPPNRVIELGSQIEL